MYNTSMPLSKIILIFLKTYETTSHRPHSKQPSPNVKTFIRSTRCYQHNQLELANVKPIEKPHPHRTSPAAMPRERRKILPAAARQKKPRTQRRPQKLRETDRLSRSRRLVAKTNDVAPPAPGRRAN